MKFTRTTARGRTTIPKSVRDAANVHAGDAVVIEVFGDRVVLRKMLPERSTYLRGLGEMMSEWASPEDEAAWRDFKGA